MASSREKTTEERRVHEDYINELETYLSLIIISFKMATLHNYNFKYFRSLLRPSYLLNPKHSCLH